MAMETREKEKADAESFFAQEIGGGEVCSSSTSSQRKRERRMRRRRSSEEVMRGRKIEVGDGRRWGAPFQICKSAKEGFM